MRALAVITIPLVLGLAACSAPGDATDFQYRQTFNKRTNGLILHEDGEGGHAGMFGTNCPFDTRSGAVTGDYDLPDEGEEVQDGEETELGEVTLAAVIPGTVHVLDKTGGIYTHVPLEVPGVVEARLTFDGVVALTGDCHLTWMGLDGVQRADLGVPACGGGLEVDPISGVGVVADPTSTVVVDGQSVVDAAVTGDLVAFDPLTDAFYVAQTGEAAVHALETDGSLRWSVETPGLVTALDDGGASGAAAVVLDMGDGSGAVAFYDGLTGAQIRYADTPSPAEDLSVSGNGEVIALVRPAQTYFFELIE
ncbi:MAG: hypothetical protein H6737_03425 [Alphaproteobacteria bacterium]|nr:hypothetical protein [Alphaproteobacteria bacterium]